MTWTKEEVIKSYRDAKNKIEQVQILAELTASDEETIIQILMDAGEFKGKFRKCENCGTMFPSVRKTIKTRPECREIKNTITQKKWRLKHNLGTIKNMNRINAKLLKEIEELETAYELLGQSKHEV